MASTFAELVASLRASPHLDGVTILVGPGELTNLEAPWPRLVLYPAEWRSELGPALRTPRTVVNAVETIRLHCWAISDDESATWGDHLEEALDLRQQVHRALDAYVDDGGCAVEYEGGRWLNDDGLALVDRGVQSLALISLRTPISRAADPTREVETVRTQRIRP